MIFIVPYGITAICQAGWSAAELGEFDLKMQVREYNSYC
jgi:hypothetical protein